MTNRTGADTMTAKLTTTTTTIENYNGWKGESLVKTHGAAYVPGRDVKDIAKDVRAIIRKAVKAGLLPQLKASVKIDRYSMGCSLDITITDISETVINVDAWRAQAAQGFMLSWGDCGGRYNATGREVRDFIGRVVSAFQRSESHGQSDYHNTNFYSDVKFDSDVSQGQFENLGEAAAR